MTLLVTVLGISALAVVVDRLFLRMEARGWIYYRKRRSRPGSLGNAFLEVHALLEPEKRHVVEVRRAESVETDDEGGKLPPDGH